MSTFVFSFRGAKDRTLNEADEAAWGSWFGEIGTQIADFGHQLPPLTPSPARPQDADPFTFLVGRGGRTGQAAGWCPVPAPLAVYRMTSEQAEEWCRRPSGGACRRVPRGRSHRRGRCPRRA